VESDPEEIIKDSADKVGKLTTTIQQLQEMITELSEMLQQAENDVKKSCFCYENIEDRNDLVKFLFGLPDHLTLLTFYEEILERDAKVMRQWDGKRSKADYDEVKTGHMCKLPLMEQFFMTLARLCLGLPELDLAQRFNISQSSVSRITLTWINLMYYSLKEIECFPPWHIVKKYMPEAF